MRKPVGVPLPWKTNNKNTITKTKLRPKQRVINVRRDAVVHINTALRHIFLEGDLLVPRWMMWANFALLLAAVSMLAKLVRD